MILARDFSPWKDLKRKCVPSGRLKLVHGRIPIRKRLTGGTARRLISDPERLPIFDTCLARRASFRRPNGTRAGGTGFQRGDGFQGLKSLANLSCPARAKTGTRHPASRLSGTKAVPALHKRRVRNLQPSAKMFGEARARKAGAP